MQSDSQLAHTIQTAGCVTLFCLLVEVALKLTYMHELESSKHVVIDLRVFVLVWFFYCWSGKHDYKGFTKVVILSKTSGSNSVKYQK